jgi:hypothetical protein
MSGVKVTKQEDFEVLQENFEILVSAVSNLRDAVGTLESRITALEQRPDPELPPVDPDPPVEPPPIEPPGDLTGRKSFLFYDTWNLQNKEIHNPDRGTFEKDEHGHSPEGDGIFSFRAERVNMSTVWTGEKRYDWRYVDGALARAKKMKARLSLRFMFVNHTALPNPYASGGQPEPSIPPHMAADPGRYGLRRCSNNNRFWWVMDWTNNRLLSELRAFYQAFAERYADESEQFIIDLECGGPWGEMHGFGYIVREVDGRNEYPGQCGDGARLFNLAQAQGWLRAQIEPLRENGFDMIMQLTPASSNHHNGMANNPIMRWIHSTYPEIGYRFDHFGWRKVSQNFTGQLADVHPQNANGWAQTKRVICEYGGGPIDGSNHRNLETIVRDVAEQRISAITNNWPFVNGSRNLERFSEVHRRRITLAARLSGYRLLPKFDWVRRGHMVELTVLISNLGVAPLWEPSVLEWRVGNHSWKMGDMTGFQPTAEVSVNGDTPSWKNNKPHEMTAVLQDVPAGQLQVRLVTRSGRFVRFCTGEMPDGDGWYTLGNV